MQIAMQRARDRLSILSRHRTATRKISIRQALAEVAHEQPSLWKLAHRTRPTLPPIRPKGEDDDERQPPARSEERDSDDAEE